MEQESSIAVRIRCELVDKYGCVFEPNRVAHFFTLKILEHPVDRRTVYFLDSLYAALMSSDKKVALRAYVQACEYSHETKFRYLRYHWENAFHEAKMRIEKFLEE